MVYVGDPVVSGLVSSLGRPGGNVTGVSMNANEIVRKDIELLKEIAPGISRVAVWMDSTNPSHLPAFAAMEATADRLKVRLQRVDVRTAADVDGGFAATLSHRAEAIAVYPLSTTPVDIKRIAEFAVKNRLPTVTNTAAVHQGGAPGRLRAERPGPVSARSDLHRPSLEGGPARRFARRAAHEARPRHQRPDGQGARGHAAAVDTVACRRRSWSRTNVP